MIGLFRLLCSATGRSSTQEQEAMGVKFPVHSSRNTQPGIEPGTDYQANALAGCYFTKNKMSCNSNRYQGNNIISIISFDL